jgi:hypothetical protein
MIGIEDSILRLPGPRLTSREGSPRQVGHRCTPWNGRSSLFRRELERTGEERATRGLSTHRFKMTHFIRRCPSALMAIVFLFALWGCETTNPAKSRVKFTINLPEWELEEQMLAYTPLGTADSEVLEFVNTRLKHSEEEESGYNDIHVFVDDGSDEKYPVDRKYKVIQVHMGMHGKAQKDFLLKSHWVYIAWLFEDNQLIDIVVTKVVPGGEDEDEAITPEYDDTIFHPEASNRF